MQFRCIFLVLLGSLLQTGIISTATTEKTEGGESNSSESGQVDFQYGQLLFDNEVTTSQAYLKLVQKGSIVFSISQINYTGKFSLTLIRNITQGTETVLKVQVKTPPSFNFSLTVSYLLIQPLAYFQHQTFNISTESEGTIFKSRFKNSPTLNFVHFTLGFSTLSVTPLVIVDKIYDEEESDEQVMYNITFGDNYTYEKEQWAEIELVIVDFLNGCSRGSIEYLQSVVGPKGKQGFREIVAYNFKLHYMVGVTIFYDSNASFIFKINQKRTLAVGKGFRYSVLGLNMSCVVELKEDDQKEEGKMNEHKEEENKTQQNKGKQDKVQQKKEEKEEDITKEEPKSLNNISDSNNSTTSQLEKKNVSETKKQSTENTKSTDNGKLIAENNTQLLKNTTQPTENITQPSQPTDNTTQPTVPPPNSGKSLVFSLRLLPLVFLLCIF